MSTPETSPSQHDEFRINGMVAAVAQDLADHKVEDEIWRSIDPEDRQIVLRFSQHPDVIGMPNEEAFKLGFKFQAALQRAKEYGEKFDAVFTDAEQDSTQRLKKPLMSRWLGKAIKKHFSHQEIVT